MIDFENSIKTNHFIYLSNHRLTKNIGGGVNRSGGHYKEKERAGMPFEPQGKPALQDAVAMGFSAECGI